MALSVFGYGLLGSLDELGLVVEQVPVHLEDAERAVIHQRVVVPGFRLGLCRGPGEENHAYCGQRP